MYKSPRGIGIIYRRTLQDMMNDKKTGVIEKIPYELISIQTEGLLLLVISAILATYFSFDLLLSTIILMLSFAGVFDFYKNYSRRSIDSKLIPKKPASPLHTPPQPTEELDAFKQQMINMLVHDLKTPLNTIICLSENGEEGSDKQRIYQSGKQMLDLIMNMLEVQKMENTNLQPDTTTQSPRKLISNAIDQVAEVARTKNIHIVQHNSTAQVNVDQHLTERILMNLLSNAVKFSPQNGKILVNTEKINHRFVKFSITDQGIGIPVNMQKKIFDKFFKASQAGKAYRYSTGIGLTFCKLATEAHGGKIGVDSTPNKGSTFWFTLPLATIQNTHIKPAKTILRSSNIGIAPPISSGLILDSSDKKTLEPWLIKLRQYEVYQLTKVKSVLKTMKFEKESKHLHWKHSLEQALYASNQEQYQWLIK